MRGIVVINRARCLKLCRYQWSNGNGYTYGYGFPSDGPGTGLSLFSGGKPTFADIRARALRDMGK